MATSAFIGTQWFSDKQNNYLIKMYKALKNNPSIDYVSSYRAPEHQYLEAKPDTVEWRLATYNNDIFGIESNPVAVFTWFSPEPDVGEGCEIGYARAIHKPVVLVIPDDDDKYEINLMPAMVADDVITLSKAKTYDFEHVLKEYYRGPIQ